jgi:hypothetical protein
MKQKLKKKKQSIRKAMLLLNLISVVALGEKPITFSFYSFLFFLFFFLSGKTWQSIDLNKGRHLKK